MSVDYADWVRRGVRHGVDHHGWGHGVDHHGRGHGVAQHGWGHGVAHPGFVRHGFDHHEDRGGSEAFGQEPVAFGFPPELTTAGVRGQTRVQPTMRAIPASGGTPLSPGAPWADLRGGTMATIFVVVKTVADKTMVDGDVVVPWAVAAGVAP